MSSNFFFNFCIILITEPMVSLTLPPSQSPGNMDCQMVDNTGFVVNYQLAFTSGNERNTEASHWTLISKSRIQQYWIERCSRGLQNLFCLKWETHDTYEVCKRTSSSGRVVCKIGIPSTEETSTNPKTYAVFVKHNATHAWQRKTKFPNDQLNLDELKCLYNQTHIDIILKPINSGDLLESYLNLTLLNKRLVRNLTNILEISRKELEEITVQNFKGNASLCVQRWCRKCGVTRLFTCYPKNPLTDSTNRCYFSTSMTVNLGIVGGLAFVAMCVSLFGFNFVKTKMNSSSEKHQWRRINPAAKTLSNTGLIEPLNNEPIFTEVQENHFYNKADI